MTYRIGTVSALFWRIDVPVDAIITISTLGTVGSLLVVGVANICELRVRWSDACAHRA